MQTVLEDLRSNGAASGSRATPGRRSEESARSGHMSLLFSTLALTRVHVAISLIAIVSGSVVMFGMSRARLLRGWTSGFLITTAATSLTGFLFHSTTFGPPQVIGVMSLVVLALACTALYFRGLAGSWRWIFIVCSVLALYFNVFVGVIQAFQKLPELSALSSGPAYPFAQILVAAALFATGIAAVRRLHPTISYPR